MQAGPSCGKITADCEYCCHGAAAEQAEAQLRTVYASLIEAYPDENARWTTRPLTVFEGIGVRTGVRGAVPRPIVLH